MGLRLGLRSNRGMRIVTYWIVVILVVLVDQATKAAAREVLEAGPRVLLPGVMNLLLVENTGAAFSVGQGAGFVFVLVAAAFIAAATVLVWRMPELPRWLVVPIGLVAGGGMGNMIDRIIDGSVTDFFSVAFVSFPVFNVADICVTVGIVLCVIGFWMWDQQDEREVTDGVARE